MNYEDVFLYSIITILEGLKKVGPWLVDFAVGLVH